MHDLAMNRRTLLKVGLLGGAILAAGGLLGRCAGDRRRPASGFAVLREADLPLLHRLVRCCWTGGSCRAHAAGRAGHAEQPRSGPGPPLASALAAQVRQLFDVLGQPLTRGPLTGIWGDWSQASDDQLRTFLLRWQNSSLALLRQGHAAAADDPHGRYACPNAWAHCGYPGPPAV